MRRASLGAAFLMACMSAFGSIAQTAPCMLITLTGTQGGPPAFKGLAGPGTLVRYGEDSNNCSAVKLQFDTGRDTVMRLAELNIAPEQLNAVFFTHMHNDHTEGFADLVTLRWMFFGTDRCGLHFGRRFDIGLHGQLPEIHHAHR
jgi:ribonuclease Z